MCTVKGLFIKMYSRGQQGFVAVAKEMQLCTKRGHRAELTRYKRLQSQLILCILQVPSDTHLRKLEIAKERRSS